MISAPALHRPLSSLWETRGILVHWVKIMLSRLGLGALLAATMVTSPTVAADWLAERLSGEVWMVAPGLQPVRVSAGTIVPEGYTVATGAGSRVRLVAGGTVITVQPGSTTRIGARRSFLAGEETIVLQQSGKIDYDVEHRDAPHFTVETPYVAVVVKGTQFSVAADRRTTAVAVGRGLVGVREYKTGANADVAPGQGVTAGLQIRGLQAIGPRPPTIRPGPPGVPSVAPAAVDLTAFRAEVAAAAAAEAKGSTASSGGSSSSEGTGNSAKNSGTSGEGNGNGNGNNGNGNNGNGGGNGNNGNGGGNGNGNNGNGNGNGGGNGNGNNGNGGGNGNGNNGNGNGNGGGNGNGNKGNGNGNGRS
ncbi:hypothetical protein EYW49_00995 [Siculibacillus lacustris]|uniref:FecR protein domain-containing protein n=1 Tax=Siculibacillus lacustris TaxID=1549641 RepID=A0A4Q9VXW1_9HYPH|nr:hypothetical protein EYW49_00995 [Siculibacillus lacustris]